MKQRIQELEGIVDMMQEQIDYLSDKVLELSLGAEWLKEQYGERDIVRKDLQFRGKVYDKDNNVVIN